MRSTTRPKPRDRRRLAAALVPALWVAGCGTPARTPEVSSQALPTSRPREESVEAARTLGEVRQRVERDPEIQAALDLPPTVLLPAAVEAWDLARRALQRIGREAGLRAATQRLSTRPPTTEVVSDASRLALIERLLDRRSDGGGALWAPGEAPLLAHLLEQAVAQRWEPSMDGRRRAPTDPNPDSGPWAPYWPQLEAGGRRWKALRSLDDFHLTQGPARGHNPRVRIQTLAGAPFEDPLGRVPKAVLGELYQEKDRFRLRHAPAELALDLQPIPGDLFLAMTAWNLTRTTHLEVRVLGAEATLRLVVSRPGILEGEPGPPDNLPGGYALRVRAAVLPAGARSLRIRPVAIQGIGRVEPTVSIGEVLQLVEGPPPTPFEGHVWAATRVDDAAVTRRRDAALKAALEELEARLRRHPGDPDALFEGGRHLREAGHLEAAYQTLRRADGLRGDHPPTLNALGEVGWELGDRQAAVDSWWRSFRLDPRGRARELIERHAPRLFEEFHQVESAAEFLQLARILQDFRRQGEVELALARFNVPRGLNLGLAEANSESLIADLAKQGYLARPGGPPSGLGTYLTRGRGEVFSNVFGSRRAPRDPPPGLAAPRGFSVSDAALLEALASGRPEAIECGLPRLRDESLGAGLARLAPHLPGLQDPWARDVLLSRAAARARQGRAAELAPLRDWLRGLLGSDERPVAWRALGLLHSLGVTDLPALDPAEGRRLVLAIDQGQAPEAAGEALLAGMGEQARGFLLEQLAGRSPARLAFAARHLVRFGRPPDAAAVAAAASRGPDRATLEDLRRALRALTGREPPEDFRRWGPWLEP